MAKQQNQTSSSTQRISTYLTIIVLIVIVLAVIALVLAGSLYLTGVSAKGTTQSGDYTAAGVLAVIGLLALTMSTFTFYQSRRQVAEMKIDVPKVMTTIECKKCKTKTVREYQRGDFVYKELGTCQKCPDEKEMITAIYKEVKEKEKKYAV